MRSVDIALSESGVGHIYIRGVRPQPIPAAHSHLSPVTLTPGGGAASSGTKKVGASGSRASTRYFSKSVTPSAARKVSSIRKFPVKLRDGLWNTRYAASAMICGVRDIRITRSPPRRFLMAAVAMVVRGHSALTAMPFSRSSPDGETQHDEAHAVLGDRIGGAAGKPFFPQVERGRIHQDVGIGCFFEMRDGVFRHHEGAARA